MNEEVESEIALEAKFATGLRAAGFPVNEEEAKIIIRIFELVSTKENAGLMDIVKIVNNP